MPSVSSNCKIENTWCQAGEIDISDNFVFWPRSTFLTDCEILVLLNCQVSAFLLKTDITWFFYKLNNIHDISKKRKAKKRPKDASTLQVPFRHLSDAFFLSVLFEISPKTWVINDRLDYIDLKPRVSDADLIWWDRCYSKRMSIISGALYYYYSQPVPRFHFTSPWYNKRTTY